MRTPDVRTEGLAGTAPRSTRRALPVKTLPVLGAIKPGMAVVCSENGQFATVDHLEGIDTIKLKKDANGIHHFIPISWVTTVDAQVHLNRPGAQAMRQWRTER